MTATQIELNTIPNLKPRLELKSSRVNNKIELMSQLAEQFNPTFPSGVTSTEELVCSKLNLASTISTDIKPKDVLLLNASNKLNLEQDKSREYVLEDVDDLICQLFNITFAIDTFQIQLFLYMIYGHYLLRYAGKTQTKLVGNKLVHFTYPPKLFPATFVTSKYGISITEVFNKLYSGYYFNNPVTRRTLIENLPEPFANEMSIFVEATLHDFLRIYSALSAPVSMGLEQAFKENYDKKTEVGNLLSDQDIIKSTITRSYPIPFSISAWRSISSRRL